MKNKKTEIATNVSSGAEKVEVVEKEIKKSRTSNGGTKKTTTVKTAKGDAALGDSVKEEKISAKAINSKNSGSRAEKESEAAKARVELALKKKEEQAKRKEEKMKKKAARAAEKKKRMAEKKEAVEKRAAEKKALIEKRAAEKKALAEKRAAQREEAIRERAHAKANKNQAHSKKKAEKAKRKSNKHRESREKGYGGWIAAVVALGVTTLALATTVTVGAMEMKGMKESMMAAHRGTMYELTGIMEHVDDDLDRIRISESPTQQSRILTDLLVQVRLAEADLGKLPISVEMDRNISQFINRTGKECERMLATLRNGGKLSEADVAKLERLYRANHSIRAELDKLVGEMTEQDWMDYLKKGAGMISETLNRLEQSTLEENRAALEEKMEEMKGAGMRRAPSEGDVSAVDAARAEALCKEYFAKYDIDEYQCVGETSNHTYSAYNMQGYDKNGTILFAEISRQDGALVGFDYYEECTAENFDHDNAQRIAEEFLDSLGYQNMTVARRRDSGSTAVFTYVYEMDGVAYYPDEVQIKVCRTRGVVTGMDATEYLKNHRGRDEVNTKINMETAREKLCGKVGVESARLAVVETARGERAAYEFLCSYDDAHYFIYIDANTGAEIAIINTQNVQ